MVNSLEPVIKEHPFFHNFPKDQLKLITSCAKNVEFHEGHFIVLEGDAANEFYFIREGSVSIELNIPERGPTTMQTLGEGEILGWSWVSPPYRWHFNAKALERTKALVFDARCLRAKCEANHDLGYEMLKRFADLITARLDATRLQLLDIYRLDDGSRPLSKKSPVAKTAKKKR
jgi:CRP/FNR family transcriptional regulator, cyclic AMP receptor protein